MHFFHPLSPLLESLEEPGMAPPNKPPILFSLNSLLGHSLQVLL